MRIFNRNCIQNFLLNILPIFTIGWSMEMHDHAHYGETVFLQKKVMML